MAIFAIAYVLIFIIFALCAYAVLQIKLFGMKVKDFWSFIEANQIILYGLTELFNAENFDNAEAIFRLFINSATTNITVRNFQDNIDAIEVAGRFGIGADRAINYESDSEGTALNYEVLSDTVSAVRRSKTKLEMDEAVYQCCAPIREDYNKRHKGKKWK